MHFVIDKKGETMFQLLTSVSRFCHLKRILRTKLKKRGTKTLVCPWLYVCVLPL